MEPWNYFNYFTEIEEYFWKKRGAHLLVSPLDWAIMEAWQKAGVPLEAALKGIDRAFESYSRSRRGAGKAQAKEAFSREELRGYFERNRGLVEKAAACCAGKQMAVASVLRDVVSSLSGAMNLLDAPG